MFKCIFLNENVWIPIEISLTFVLKGPINNIPALVKTMAWRRPGDKPLSEPMMVNLPTHICVSRPQWVKSLLCSATGSDFITFFSIFLWLNRSNFFSVTWKSVLQTITSISWSQTKLHTGTTAVYIRWMNWSAKRSRRNQIDDSSRLKVGLKNSQCHGTYIYIYI